MSAASTLNWQRNRHFDQIIVELREVLNMRSWDEVVFCGFGEPTEKLDVLLEVTRWIRQHYGRPIRIRVNTNGHGYVINQGRDVAAESEGGWR